MANQRQVLNVKQLPVSELQKIFVSKAAVVAPQMETEEGFAPVPGFTENDRRVVTSIVPVLEDETTIKVIQFSNNLYNNKNTKHDTNEFSLESDGSLVFNNVSNNPLFPRIELGISEEWLEENVPLEEIRGELNEAQDSLSAAIDQVETELNEKIADINNTLGGVGETLTSLNGSLVETNTVLNNNVGRLDTKIEEHHTASIQHTNNVGEAANNHANSINNALTSILENTNINLWLRKGHEDYTEEKPLRKAVLDSIFANTLNGWKAFFDDDTIAEGTPYPRTLTHTNSRVLTLEQRVETLAKIATITNVFDTESEILEATKDLPLEKIGAMFARDTKKIYIIIENEDARELVQIGEMICDLEPDSINGLIDWLLSKDFITTESVADNIEIAVEDVKKALTDKIIGDVKEVVENLKDWYEYIRPYVAVPAGDFVSINIIPDEIDPVNIMVFVNGLLEQRGLNGWVVEGNGLKFAYDLENTDLVIVRVFK